MLDLVIASIGSFRGWIAWIFGGLIKSMCDLVDLAIGSSSPLESTSKGVQDKERVITSKGVLQQKPLIIPKNTQVAVDSKGEEEPIAKSTRSYIDLISPPTIQLSSVV